ncbi:hypothetical protein PENTCL1PPCAC_28479, partial [Pristionchus entomophagus]
TQTETGRDPWVLDPSMHMEEMAGCSHAEVIGSSIVDPSDDDDMAGDVLRGAVRRGMMPVNNKEPRDFVFLKQIGEGAFSTVYRAREVKSKTDYAVKVVVKSHVARNQKTKLIIREKNVMALLTYVHGSHPFVVSLYCTFQDEERLYFALSYCSRGDLLETLKRVSSFDQTTTKFCSAEIICALQFIHGCGIVHRDLKPENILLKGDGHICLTDFGSAKILADEEEKEEQARKLNVETAEDRGERRATFVGTAQYVSPEMLRDDPVGIECDYWALGALMYQMMSGQPPFRAVNDYHLLKKIQLLDFSFPPGFPPIGLDLVQKLLVLDPALRLGNPDQPPITDHEFYEDIDFASLHMQTPPEIHPYVPASMGEPEFWSDIVIEPGLDNNALTRLTMGHLSEMQKAFEDNDSDKKTSFEYIFGKEKNIYEIGSVTSSTGAPPGHDQESSEDRLARIRAGRIERQKAESEWHKFAEENLILHKGFVDKKKGLFARRRMFLLTEGPHIYYVDPVNMVYKGQIPLCFETKTEAKNFRTFFVHTPNRTYYLFDPSRRANEWCEAIDKARDKYFKEPTPKTADDEIIEITKLFGIIPFITFRTTRAARLQKERRKQEQRERKERTEIAKRERIAREKEEKREKKRQEAAQKAERKAKKERERMEKKQGRTSR